MRLVERGLFRTAQAQSVLFVNAGQARMRTVRIGPRGAAEAEVTDGAAAGEPVILSPSDRIVEASPVWLRCSLRSGRRRPGWPASAPLRRLRGIVNGWRTRHRDCDTQP